MVSNLYPDDVACVGEFRTTFRTIPAPVAQGIEQRFPKPQVACSIHAGSATRTCGIMIRAEGTSTCAHRLALDLLLVVNS